MLAVFAVLLQAAAPLAIAPPRGQAVHFAHSHHGEDRSRTGSSHTNPTQPDGGSCPVCQALQAAGAGIAAPAIVLAEADLAAPPEPARRADAPAAEPPSSHRARAPPIRA